MIFLCNGGDTCLFNQSGDIIHCKYQLLQLCTARTVSSILVSVQLYTGELEVCHWLTNEKQRKTDVRLTDQ